VLKDEFSMPVAPVSGPIAPAGPRPASFTINPDGTMDYTPSQYAEDLAAVLVDPNGTFRRELDSRARLIAQYAQTVKNTETYINDATRIMATTGKRTRRYIEAQQNLTRFTQDNKRYQRLLAAEYADLTTFLSTMNASPAGVGAPRPPTTIDLKNIAGRVATDGEKAIIEARVNVAYQIMETLIPPVSATGQATNLGYGPTGRVVVELEPQGRRAGYYPGRRATAVGPTESFRTVTHELLHGVEDHNPTMAARIAAWYKTRTAPGNPGSQLERLDVLTGNNFYDPFEQSRPDQFAAYYIGKDYSVNGIGGTEVLSMFADYVTDQKRESFIRDDPEWVKFCIDVLADPGSYQ